MPEGKIEKCIDTVLMNPVSKTIFDLIPFVGPIFQNTYNSIRQKRLRFFHDELRHTGILDEHMADDDLVHAAYCTIEAVLRTKEEEKIRCFASILSCAYEDIQFRKSNSIEEYIQLIGDLSIDEMVILTTINQANEEMRNHPAFDVAGHKIPETKWHVLERMLKDTLGITEKNEILSKLIRLQRTGCVQLHPGTDGGYGDITLLPVFYSIKKFLVFNESNRN